LNCPKTDVNLETERGPPLLQAIKLNMPKFVNILLLNGADLAYRSPKDQGLQDLTQNKAILNLLTKYDTSPSGKHNDTIFEDILEEEDEEEDIPGSFGKREREEAQMESSNMTIKRGVAQQDIDTFLSSSAPGD
jgi:hypothetical protein